MKSTNTLKSILSGIFQWLGIALSFFLSLILVGLLLPFPDALSAARPAMGIVQAPFDMILNALVNATLIFWIVKRSSYKGLQLIVQLFLSVFGVQTFLTQLETAYFIQAFPLLTGNLEVYTIVFRAFLSTLLVAVFATLITGSVKTGRKVRNSFCTPAQRTLVVAAWLGLLYVALYFIFGYFIAYQSADVRSFYGQTGDLKPFFEELKQSFINKPDSPFFQYCRGVVWVLCLLPIVKGFTGDKTELILLSTLFFAFMPTIQLLFANPLMPASVGLYHFAEVALSTGIFGAVTACLVAERNTKY